ncbi:MAG: hypothetical protein KGN76_16755, partial [Acidobacteriota bacterium]|nr:hypothetical protein [Acidobacteriota bacterium]
MRKTLLAAFSVCLLTLGVPFTGRAAQQSPPVPQPFPTPGGGSNQQPSAPQAPPPAAPSTDGRASQPAAQQPAAGQAVP